MIHATDTTWCPSCKRTTIGPVCQWCPEKTHTERYSPKHEEARARVYAFLRRRGRLSHAVALQLVHEVAGL